MKFKLLLLALFANLCFAQSPIIVGIRGGLPIGDVVQGVQSGSAVFKSTNDWVVGPTIGVRLPLGFSVAADALITPLHFSANSGAVSASSLALEFPVLVRYAAGSGPLHPFVGAGASVRHLGNLGNVASFFSDSSNSSIEKSLGIGFVIAGGVELKLGPIHISPELRYTHWGSNSVSTAFSNVIRLNSNEGQVLVGITF